MTATWLRLETDRPSRLQAPSHAPPPSVEGIDRLFESPLALRHVALRPATTHGEDIHLFQFPNEDRMGTVRVTCGGQSLDKWDAQTLSTFAVNALRLSSTKGAGQLLDSCTTRTPSTDGASKSAATFAASGEHSNNAQRYLRDFQQWQDLSTKQQPLSDLHGGSGVQTPPLFWESLKPNIHRFASSSAAVPLHPFACVMERRRHLPAGSAVIVGQTWMIHSAATAASPIESPSSSPSILQRTPSNILALVPHKQVFRSVLQLYRGVLYTMARCLAEAFPQHPLFTTTKTALETLTNASMNTGDSIVDASGNIFFVACFNLGGLLFASKSFVQFTSQWEKVLVASLAMDQLIPKAASFDTDVNKDADSAIRLTEFPLKMTRISGGQRAVDVVVLSVGSALSIVFALLPSPGQGGMKGSVLAETLRTKLCSKTKSAHYTRACQRNISAGPPSRHSEDQYVPLFPGLHGRGTGSLQKHIDVCTVEPDDATSSKLLDELSSSEDEAEESTFCGCAVPGNNSAAPELGDLSSDRVLSTISQDTFEGIVVRFAAKLMKIEERSVSPLIVKGGCVAFRTGLHSDSVIAPPSSVTPDGVLSLERQRQLHGIAYHAFEVSIWRHALAISHHRCITSVMRTATRESLSAVEAFRRCRGAEVDWASHFSHSVVDDGHRLPTVIIQHAQQVMPATEACAALTVSAALDSKAVATHMDPSRAADREGFLVSSTAAPYGVSPESWRALRSFSALSQAVMEGCLSLQRAGLTSTSS